MPETATRASPVTRDDVDVEAVHAFAQTWITGVAFGQSLFAEGRRRDEAHTLPFVFVIRPDDDMEMRVVTSREMAPLLRKPLLQPSFAIHAHDYRLPCRFLRRLTARRVAGPVLPTRRQAADATDALLSHN